MYSKQIIPSLLIVLCAAFAVPALAAKPGSGLPPNVGTTLHVECVNWTPTGGLDQHIHVQALVVDEAGTPVIGAQVLMREYRNGAFLKDIGGPTGLNSGLDGGVSCPNGPPLGNVGFTLDFCNNKAESGFYEVEITSVTKEGFTWDGVQPTQGLSIDHVKP